MKHIFESSYGKVRYQFVNSAKLTYCYGCFHWIYPSQLDEECQGNDTCHCGGYTDSDSTGSK
jgi:hypothetical protein